MRWRRAAVWAASLTALVVLSGCEGTVVKRTWEEHVVGKPTCTLEIKPDPQKNNGKQHENYTKKRVRNKDCVKCPEGARYPACASEREPVKAIRWEPGG